MYKIILAAFLVLGVGFSAAADISEYRHSFDVRMDMDLSDLEKYIQKIYGKSKLYDKGYVSRYKLGNKFKTEFSRIIKSYGTSENRIKSSYEDDMLEMINMLPKEAYQYVGPMLHKIPGMSEKILNLPGIKETKNKFPDKIDEKYKAIEDIEYISPALYVILMPRDFENQKFKDLDKPESKPAKINKKRIRVPDFSKQNSPLAEIEKNKPNLPSGQKAIDLSKRTIFPTLTTPLTTADAQAFLDTFDAVTKWGEKHKVTLVRAGTLLNYMEKEQGNALIHDNLKDMVNPCQSLVLKTRVAGIYEDFRGVVSKQGFSPEEWAYTCDKTLKAFRISSANHSTAYAIQFHRRGYYDQYIKILPEKWQKGLHETEAAIVAMYSALKNDVEAVRPIKGKILEKIVKNDGRLLTAPIIY